jgi:hypothetical protein
MNAPPPSEHDLRVKRVLRLASVVALALGILIAITPIPWYVRIPVSFVPLLAVTPLVRAWGRRQERGER